MKKGASNNRTEPTQSVSRRKAGSDHPVVRQRDDTTPNSPESQAGAAAPSGKIEAGTTGPTSFIETLESTQSTIREPLETNLMQ